MSLPNSPAPRSTFVTVVAWIFIVISGFMTVIGALQNIMLHSMFMETTHGAMQVPPDAGVPAFAAFMMNNMQWFFVAFLVVSATTLIASLGLLKRKNWARIAFIGIMVVGITWNMAGLVLTASMLSGFTSQQMPPGPPDMGIFKNLILGFNVVFALGLSGVFGWIIKRLRSEALHQEFT